MEKIKSIIALFFTSLLFVSCEEVINLDLETINEKYVIEANFTNVAGGAKVAISKTKSFNSTGDFIGQSGAIVTIEDNSGVVTRLTESNNKGIYIHPTLKGNPESTYKLKVDINGQSFTSSSKMPAVVKLDSVYALELKLFDGNRKFTHVQFRDPVGKGNNYRFIEYRNGIYTKAIMIENDDFTDGNLINQMLRPRDFNDETKLKIGDKIRVEFLTIEDAIYKYWFSVDSGAQGGGDSAAPINPVSNIKGGAIGYFSAHTFQSMEYVVK